jgi:hypothetical protein
MYSSLLSQQWKQTVRSKYFKQGWGVKILIGFLVVYFGGLFLTLGLFMPELLEELYPDAEMLTPIFSGFVLYYILSDLAMRFFLQDLSVLTVQHYLTLPVKKSKIIHFLLRGSIFNFFNTLPLFIVVPFGLRTVSSEYGAIPGGAWLLSFVFIVLSNHFLAIYIKRALAVKKGVFFAFAAVVGGLFLGDFMEWFSLIFVSEQIFSSFGPNPTLLFIPLLVMVAFYFLNFSFLKAHTYLDLWKSKASENVNTTRFSFLESKGIVGSLVANELKLITRNKRTKSILFITLLFSAYGLIFYLNPQYNEGYGWLIFVGIFMTGVFMINYGQFLVGWEGAYFDGILTRSYEMEDFYKAKFILIAVTCVITYILSVPYVYFGIKALYINTASFIYNIGLNSFVLLYASTYNRKKIDLSKGSAFNYQGTSATQFIIVLPLMVVPIIIFQSFNAFGAPNGGLIALAAVGLISMAFSKYWFKAIVSNFKEKKYRNAEGFREKS